MSLEKEGLSIRWKPAPGATGYRLERAPSPGGPYASLAAKLIEPMHLDATVAKGASYAYRVVAFNVVGDGPASSEVTKLVVAPPPAPTGLAAAPGNARVVLRWNPSDGAEKYAVKRAASPGGPYAAIASAPSPGYTDRAVTNGKTYEYAVAAVNAGGESPNSPTATATPLSAPEAPKGLAAAPGNRSVTLSWTASPGATAYHVKRSVERGGPFTIIAKDVKETTYKDGAATNGTLYDYAVTALNAGGESPPSGIARATPIEAPPVPTGLALSSSNGRVLLMWSASKGATGYSVKRATARGGPFVVLSKTAEPTYSDASVTNGATYYYVVAAVNGGGESAGTPEVEATPVEPPRAPTEVTAKAGDRKVFLSWTPCAGATEYAVKRSTSPEGPFTTIAKPTESRHVDASVENKTTYHYVVNTMNPAGRSPASARVSATPVTPA